MRYNFLGDEFCGTTGVGKKRTGMCIMETNIRHEFFICFSLIIYRYTTTYLWFIKTHYLQEKLQHLAVLFIKLILFIVNRHPTNLITVVQINVSRISISWLTLRGKLFRQIDYCEYPLGVEHNFAWLYGPVSEPDISLSSGSAYFKENASTHLKGSSCVKAVMYFCSVLCRHLTSPMVAYLLKCIE